MSMRISTATRYAQLVADMQTNLASYTKLTEQLSSGKKLTSITDDPIASVNTLNTKRQLNFIGTFESNVNLASTELSALDDTLTLATGYLSTAWDKAVQANNQTYGKSSLEALKIEIDEITKTMVDLANTEYNDNYLFAGANTKTITYKFDVDGNIVYNGTPQDNPDYIRETEVADGVFEIINTTGDKVFGWYNAVQEETADGKKVFIDAEGKKVIETVDEETGDKTYAYEDGTAYTGDVADLKKSIAEEDYSGVLGTLKVLSNALQQVIDGDETEGYKNLNATLDMFANSLQAITNEQTKFGGVANRLEMTASTLSTNDENLQAYLSDLNEVDYTTAVTAWMQAQYAYQASLQVSASSMNLSLLNFM